MFRVFLLSIAITCSFGGLVRRPLPADGRIVGGKDARIEDFPYQLSLRSNGLHICGASIIDKNWVLTAAHCVDSASVSSISFRAGSNNRTSGGTIHNAVNITIHSDYNPTTIEYDIALVYVKEAFQIGSKTVDVVKLADKHGTAGTQAVVSGWGRLISGGKDLPTILQQVDVSIVDNDVCNIVYSGGITDSMICAGYYEGGKSFCQYDSGGPLVANKQLVGVVSWAYGCGFPRYPGVYASVGNLRGWIKQKSGI